MSVLTIAVYLSRAILFSLVVGALWTVYQKKIKRVELFTKEYWCELCLGCYLAALFQITVIRNFASFFDFSNHDYGLNEVIVIPFSTTVNTLLDGIWPFVYNLFGNLLWFVPFGFLLPIVRKQKTSKEGILVNSIMLSLSIEVLQYIFQTGFSDIDDILINVAGAYLGFLLFEMCHRLRVKS